MTFLCLFASDFINLKVFMAERRGKGIKMDVNLKRFSTRVSEVVRRVRICFPVSKANPGARD